jgi:hypothetical protein
MTSPAQGETITSDMQIEAVQRGCVLAMMLLAERCAAATEWRLVSRRQAGIARLCSGKQRMLCARQKHRRCSRRPSAEEPYQHSYRRLTGNYVTRRHRLRVFNTR